MAVLGAMRIAGVAVPFLHQLVGALAVAAFLYAPVKPLGRAAVLTAALFAVGHLLEPAPWRLAVFFPALIFAWLRARTGTVVGAAVCHFIFNVWLLLLERAAFG